MMAVSLYFPLCIQLREGRRSGARRMGGWASDLTDKSKRIISTEEEEYVHYYWGGGGVSDL